jgi:hypothetical protein
MFAFFCLACFQDWSLFTTLYNIFGVTMYHVSALHCFFFDHTQDFALARWMHYCLSHTSSNTSLLIVAETNILLIYIDIYMHVCVFIPYAYLFINWLFSLFPSIHNAEINIHIYVFYEHKFSLILDVHWEVELLDDVVIISLTF